MHEAYQQVDYCRNHLGYAVLPNILQVCEPFTIIKMFGEDPEVERRRAVFIATVRRHHIENTAAGGQPDPVLPIASRPVISQFARWLSPDAGALCQNVMQEAGVWPLVVTVLAHMGIIHGFDK
jgi:hypothetical protein